MTIQIYPTPSPTPVSLEETLIDSFSRVRVSNPETLFDSKQIFDNQPLFWDDAETSGSGTTSSHSANTASTTIGVALNTAGTRIRQSFQSFNYQPGKSQWILMTGILAESGGGTGIDRGWGYGNDKNGVFLVDEAGTYNVRVRSYATGSAVDTDIPQSSWNVDKFDGTGPSGITIDFTKSQIFAIDLEWLGVGGVRFGFVIDRVIYVAHVQNHANSLDVVYMSTPNLPIRYWVTNDGTGAASTVEHICCSVMSEGGSQDLGIVRNASTDGIHIDADTENTIYPIIGMRLKSAYIGAVVKILKVAVQLHTASETGEWILALNPTVSGTFTYNDETNSAVQIAKNTAGAATTVTNIGTRIDSGYSQSTSGGGGSGGDSSPINNSRYLGVDITETTFDTIVLCWRPIGGTNSHDVEGSITWREL